MHSHGNICALEHIGKPQVGRRIISRISTHDEQHVHFAGTHVGHEILDRVGLIDGVGIDWIGVDDRLTDIAERLINGMGQSVYRGRLMIARNNNARTMPRREIRRNRPHKFRPSVYLRTVRGHCQSKKKFAGESIDLACPQWQAVICFGSRRSGRALDHV